MFKSLLLSGLFRVQPFFNYFVVVVLIAPLVAASGSSSSAKQSKVIAKIAAETGESDSVLQGLAAVSEPEITEVLTVDKTNSRITEFESVPQEISAVIKPQLKADETESLLAKDYSCLSNAVHTTNSLAEVELAPQINISQGELNSGNNLQAADIESFTAKETSEINLSVATQATPDVRESQSKPNTETPVIEQPNEASAEQVDPIGSPHPIPWKWIVSTQEAIGSKGASGVRYYRSVPVISPDGKYSVYSRVQIEVKPEMYNSKVTSLLFVENRETKKLQIIASTSRIGDPLLSARTALPEQDETRGEIGVLVPVSWSEKSDRFLARKFEGVFNTGDSTDHAVIWDRQKNASNTVSPVQEQNDHEKIAVLLGWSKNQPDQVLFRAGEMGDENWPLVKVSTDGKTVVSTDADQPVTFGDKLTEVWAGPQVASR